MSKKYTDHNVHVSTLSGPHRRPRRWADIDAELLAIVTLAAALLSAGVVLGYLIGINKACIF